MQTIVSPERSPTAADIALPPALSPKPSGAAILRGYPHGSAFPALAGLLRAFSRRGREFARHCTPPAWRLDGVAPNAFSRLKTLARALRSSRGEASGVALASDLIATYAGASREQRDAFFTHLARCYDPDPDAIAAAWQRYRDLGSGTLPELASAVEAPRQELFRRLNLAPGGTGALVRMRQDLFQALDRDRGELARVDADLSHLLQSWFNPGFLSLKALDWSSPAALLERIIRYEAVHDIRGWEDLRRRLEPSDRRCYAFFHPSLPEEPLIFVEVALTGDIAGSVQQILSTGRTPLAADTATTAIFYSISNCQQGLRGISFGHFLIKQVANDLRRKHPNLTRFATLSPVPGLRGHLRTAAPELDRAITLASAEIVDGCADDGLRRDMEAAAVSYLVNAKSRSGEPLDPVARFHLGNGARLERLNWRADVSENGMARSGGLMVNYLYDLDRIEDNHEDYAHRNVVALGTPFRRLAEAVTVERGSRERKA